MFRLFGTLLIILHIFNVNNDSYANIVQCSLILVHTILLICNILYGLRIWRVRELSSFLPLLVDIPTIIFTLTYVIMFFSDSGGELRPLALSAAIQINLPYLAVHSRIFKLLRKPIISVIVVWLSSFGFIAILLIVALFGTFAIIAL